MRMSWNIFLDWQFASLFCVMLRERPDVNAPYCLPFHLFAYKSTNYEPKKPTFYKQNNLHLSPCLSHQRSSRSSRLLSSQTTMRPIPTTHLPRILPLPRHGPTTCITNPRTTTETRYPTLMTTTTSAILSHPPQAILPLNPSLPQTPHLHPTSQSSSSSTAAGNPPSPSPS